MDINIFWFIIIVFLFTGFFFLEGFDYGVGIILPFVAKNDESRRMVFNSIGSVWDGNEVWMIGAGGVIFAAFPQWYATMFSSFYMALLVILFALALRGLSFEFRGKSKHRTWRKTWDFLMFIGSFLLALLWGVFVGNLVRGIPIGPKMTYVGNFGDLLNVYSLFVGITFVFLFALHGCAFVRLKIQKDSIITKRIDKGLPAFHLITCIIFIIFIGYTTIETNILHNFPALILAVLSLLSLIAAGIKIRKTQMRTFIFTSIAIALITITVFVYNYPNVLVSSLNHDWNLTIYNASSSAYSMHIMRTVALIFVPIVLIYQCFSYWVFRKRLTSKDLEY
ncbi:MAG: cytochrome d ubiquinol oxidase subunit II [bacterium]|nr:cytochrome d ubiquinol oxidase subunit II [bacterium]